MDKRLKNTTWATLWASLLAACLSVWGSNATYAQRMDSFENGELRLQLVESDCQARLTTHEITLVAPHSGSASEMFDIECGAGSMAFLAYPTEPNLVLDEFQPGLWVRSSSGRIQLGVRVVFPLAEHPVTGGRLNTVLWGDVYANPGQWQQLRVIGLEKKLSAESVAMRQRYGSDLKLDGAFIDCLVLNAYTGPGNCRVQIDDLELKGLVSVAVTGQNLPTNWREKWRWRHEPNRPSAEQRFWQTSNRPSTWLHYHRESAPWISSLGFTGLLFGEVPSEKQLVSVSEAGLAAILPPPPHNLKFEETAASAIQGWFAGAALDAQQADAARIAARRVSEMPAELRRPLVSEALEQYWLFSRIADEVIVPYPAQLAAGTTREKLAWVTRSLATTKKRGAGWVSILAGPSPALVDQIRAAYQIIAPEREFDETQADPLGLRFQVASGVLSGARGFVFRTFKPLELNGAGERATLATIRWIHSDLALWGPWIVAGQPAAPATVDRADFVANTWSVSNSRLVLALAMPDDAQYCVPATADRPIEFEIPSFSTPEQVFRLAGGELERLETEVTPTGLRWRVSSPMPIESFVVTSNPLVIDFIRRQLSLRMDQRADDQLEVVSYNLALASQVVAARFNLSRDAQSQTAASDQLARLSAAQRQLEQGYQALRSNQPGGALSLASRASDAVQSVLVESHRVATSNLAAPQSSPLVIGPASLGYHWLLADACLRSEWQDLVLPGAEFLLPQQMESLGWSLEQRSLEDIELQVEYLPNSGNNAPGLRLAAYAQAGSEDASLQGGYEGASSRVRSAAAQVHVGQLVRVAAQARILRAPATPESGLLVYDNQAGPGLGQLVRGQAGDLVAIELYRLVVANGEFRILAECRGECDIVLESLRTSVIEPAVNRRSFVTSPLPPSPSVQLNTGQGE